MFYSNILYSNFFVVTGAHNRNVSAHFGLPRKIVFKESWFLFYKRLYNYLLFFYLAILFSDINIKLYFVYSTCQINISRATLILFTQRERRNLGAYYITDIFYMPTCPQLRKCNFIECRNFIDVRVQWSTVPKIDRKYREAKFLSALCLILLFRLLDNGVKNYVSGNFHRVFTEMGE